MKQAWYVEEVKAEQQRNIFPRQEVLKLTSEWWKSCEEIVFRSSFKAKSRSKTTPEVILSEVPYLAFSVSNETAEGVMTYMSNSWENERWTWWPQLHAPPAICGMKLGSFPSKWGRVSLVGPLTAEEGSPWHSRTGVTQSSHCLWPECICGCRRELRSMCGNTNSLIYDGCYQCGH